MISKVYSIWFKLTRNCADGSDSCPSGLSSWRHAGGHRFEPVWGRIFFVRILRKRWKLIIHRDSPHSPQKDVRNTRWKLCFFLPHFTAFLTKFHRQTSTRVVGFQWLSYVSYNEQIFPLQDLHLSIAYSSICEDFKSWERGHWPNSAPSIVYLSQS